MKPARKSVGDSRRPKLSASSGVYGSQPQPIAPDVLLKIVELVKKYYAKPSPQRQRGRPRTFSGLAFLLLTVVGMVLRTCKAVELHTRLTKDATLRQALGCDRVPIGEPWSDGWRPHDPKLRSKSACSASRFWPR